MSVDMKHQSHYDGLPVQPMEQMLASFTPAEMRGFLRGNIIKYRLRAGHKKGSDDGAKLRVYVDWLDEFCKTGTIAQFNSGKVDQ